MKKGLWSIITTEGGGNLTAQQQREYTQKDEKALGILLTSVADDIVHHLDQATSAKIAWDTLERTFGAKGKHSKISLKMQLYSLTMHENETLSSVVNRLKSICTQLSYIQCNIDEDDKIAILLKSLPIQYEHIVTVLKEKEPIPSLESIINSLQEEESKHTHTLMRHPLLKLYLCLTQRTSKYANIAGKPTMLPTIVSRLKSVLSVVKLGIHPNFALKAATATPMVVMAALPPKEDMFTTPVVMTMMIVMKITMAMMMATTPIKGFT